MSASVPAAVEHSVNRGGKANEDPSPNTNSPATSSPSTEDRRATFRKRRLSLPLHHLSTTSEEDPAYHSSASSSPQTRATSPERRALSPAAGGSGGPESPILAADEKAHTFRKRRLSLTQNKCHPESSPDRQHTTNKRLRRSSETSSVGSSFSNSHNAASSFLLLSPKTMHSGELIQHDRPLPSPAVHSDNVLYTKPSLPPPPPAFSLPPSVLSPFADADAAAAQGGTTFEEKQQEQPTLLLPKWHRRQTIELDHKLPFPKEIVGTYSCHGVEPVYDSSYEEEEEVEEQEQKGVDDTTEDFWNHGMGKPAAAILTAAQELEEGADPPASIEATEQNTEGTINNNNDDDGSNNNKPTTAAKINQDRGGVAYPYGNSPHTALFAVYDGHGQGGELVSQFALHEIQRRLEKHPDFGTNLDKAFKDTFCAVDEALKQEPIIEPLFAGTTACVALLSGRRLTTANAGDSRAVVARRLEAGSGWQAIDLTQDQNPDTPNEMERILASGGYVSPSPGPGLSARVWLDTMCTQIGLAMARSIGDHAVSTVGVIAEPVVSFHDVQENDEFLVLASDGKKSDRAEKKN